RSMITRVRGWVTDSFMDVLTERLTRIRRHFVIYFLLHRANHPRKGGRLASQRSRLPPGVPRSLNLRFDEPFISRRVERIIEPETPADEIVRVFADADGSRLDCSG